MYSKLSGGYKTICASIKKPFDGTIFYSIDLFLDYCVTQME